MIALPRLLAVLGIAPPVLLAAGGLLYSVGAIVYSTQRPDPWPRTFGFHDIFHALVITAAAAQMHRDHRLGAAGDVTAFEITAVRAPRRAQLTPPPEPSIAR